MGLSSSQARLLNLTGRMHQIEYKAAKLEAQKLQMANESRQVFNEYQQALEKTKVQLKTMNNDGSTGFIDATYDNLTAAGYKFEIVDDSMSIPRITSAKLLKHITPVTNKDNIPEGFTAIYDVNDLKNINNSSGKYILMNDIELDTYSEWTPIEMFSGVLNGNGHVIKGFKARSSGGNAGIFRNINNAEFYNLGIENGTVNGSGPTGLLAGVAEGNIIIENCYILDGKVTSGYCTGGFIGGVLSQTQITFTNCYSDLHVNYDCQYIDYYLSPYNSTTNYSYRIIDSYYIDNNLKDTDGNLISNSLATATTMEEIDKMAGEYCENINQWITNMLNEGLLILKKPDGKGDYYDVSVATDTNLQEVADESGLRKAEAKYEADMRRIDMKDRKYDYDLAALDNERNAIKNEMETLKTVAKDNVDRTFKLFG